MYKCSVNILNMCLKDMKELIKKYSGTILHEAKLKTYSMLVIEFPKEESFWDLTAEKFKREDEIKSKLNIYL